jgi:hypothetical protein
MRASTLVVSAQAGESTLNSWLINPRGRYPTVVRLDRVPIFSRQSPRGPLPSVCFLASYNASLCRFVHFTASVSEPMRESFAHPTGASIADSGEMDEMVLRLFSWPDQSLDLLVSMLARAYLNSI